MPARTSEPFLPVQILPNIFSSIPNHRISVTTSGLPSVRLLGNPGVMSRACQRFRISPLPLSDTFLLSPPEPNHTRQETAASSAQIRPFVMVCALADTHGKFAESRGVVILAFAANDSWSPGMRPTTTEQRHKAGEVTHKAPFWLHGLRSFIGGGLSQPTKLCNNRCGNLRFSNIFRKAEGRGEGQQPC